MAARGKKAAAKALVAWKGFDKNLSCLGYQFEVGKTYTHDGKVSACASGFHACENPLDVWAYYGLENGNRFCRVHLSGATDRHESDSKIAAQTIFVESEVTLGEMIKAGVEYTVAATKGKGDDPSGNYAQIGSSGDDARIGSSGNSARIGSSGYYARIGSSGNYARIGSSGYYAQIGSSGNYAQIGSSGYYAQIEATGENAVIASAGYNACAKGRNGTWVSLAEFDRNGKCVGFATGCIGQNGLKEGVSYIAKGGKLVEAQS
jgi:hypothetical protein